MLEIERRFLVPIVPDLSPFVSYPIEQFYLANMDGIAVRVRFVNEVFECLTFKKNLSYGVNFEMNYPVDARKDDLLQILGDISELPHVKKLRYEIPHGSLKFELDIISKFGEEVAIAEIEVPSLDHDLGELPPWIGEEITGQRVWSNASIAKFGFPTI